MNYRILYEGTMIGVCSEPYGDTGEGQPFPKFKVERTMLHMPSAERLTGRLWNLWSMQDFPFVVVAPDATVWEGCWFAGWLNTTMDEDAVIIERATIAYVSKGKGAKAVEDWLKKVGLRHMVPMSVLFPDPEET